MSKVAAIAKLAAQPGKRDELAKGLQVMLDQDGPEFHLVTPLGGKGVEHTRRRQLTG